MVLTAAFSLTATHPEAAPLNEPIAAPRGAFPWAISLHPHQSAAHVSPKAFPGAEGFGANAVGGRGGRVLEVTNLDDSGPGSLRAALEATGPRIVVFRTGGTITLLERIKITSPYVTVAGQTAPGGGILLRNHPSNIHVPIEIATHDVVIRYIRCRPGPSRRPAENLDAFTISSGYNVILDHVSASWATDENVHIWYDSHNVTIQWSIISEGLFSSTHVKGPHSKGLLIGSVGSRDISIHHNLFAHNQDRNPEVNTTGVADVVNNVIYNYGGKAAFVEDKYTQVPVPLNFVGNYVKAGVNAKKKAYELRYMPAPAGIPRHGASIFVAGNIGPHRPDETHPEAEIVPPEDRGFITATRHPAPCVSTTSASAAYDLVLTNAGATFPIRDAVDQRIVSDVRNGTGHIIDDPSQVGGWPNLDPGTPPRDSDHDGMPDDWERARHLNPLSDDSAKDRDGDGYTNIEEYINELVGSDPKSPSNLRVIPSPEIQDAAVAEKLGPIAARTYRQVRRTRFTPESMKPEIILHVIKDALDGSRIIVLGEF